MRVKVKLLPRRLLQLSRQLILQPVLVDVQATFESEDGAKLLSGMFTRLHVALPTEHNQIVVAASSGELQHVWRIALYFDRTFR